MSVLQKDAGFNTMDAKPVDFVAAVESAIFKIEVPEGSKNVIRQKLSRLLTCHRPCTTLTKAEHIALKGLRKDDNIVILPADKGRATVVLDRTEYNQKMHSLLDDPSAYRTLETDPTVAQRNKVMKALNRFKARRKLDDRDLDALRPKDSAMARIYGLPKVHKEGVPLRPIVSLRGTPIFGMAKWLSKRISHINEKSTTTVKSSQQFLRMIANMRIEDHEMMVSFDVTSLFTSIPQDLAIAVIRERLNEDEPYVANQMNTEDLLELLRFCLETHFTFGETKYEQIKGTPMGSPISGVIAEAVLQKLECTAMQRYRPVFWARYVDDTFVVINKSDKMEFLQTLNSVYPDIQFTMEEEKTGNLAFLDVLVSRQPDGNLTTSVHRKATNTDRILHHDSNHPVSHKIGCIRALFDRIETHCSTPLAKAEERAYLYKVCAQNGYTKGFVTRYSHRSVQRSSSVEPGNWSSLPYISTVSEATARILSGYGVKVAHKPNQTVRSHVMRPKLPLPAKEKSGVVYRIDCNDCDCSYVGETARRLKTRMQEHQAAVRRNERLSQVWTHSVENNHTFNFEEVKVIANDPTKCGRLVKEAWFSDHNSINRHIGLNPAYEAIRQRRAGNSYASQGQILPQRAAVEQDIKDAIEALSSTPTQPPGRDQTPQTCSERTRPNDRGYRQPVDTSRKGAANRFEVDQRQASERLGPTTRARGKLTS